MKGPRREGSLVDINLCLSATVVLLFRLQGDEWLWNSLELCELQSSQWSR